MDIQEVVPNKFIRFGRPVKQSINYLKLKSPQRNEIASFCRENDCSHDSEICINQIKWWITNRRDWKSVDLSTLFEYGMSCFYMDKQGLPVIETLDQATSLVIRINSSIFEVEGTCIGKGQDYEPLVADHTCKKIDIPKKDLAGKEISRHKSLNEAYDKILQLVEKEINDNINNEGYFYDLITDLANSEGRKFSYTYGGGWLHSTYDRTLSAIDEKRYDYIDAELLDSDIINFIDEAVQGENYIESYRITESSDDFEWCDTKEEVIKYIEDKIGEDNVKWVEIIKEYYDENGSIIDSEVGEDITEEFM